MPEGKGRGTMVVEAATAAVAALARARETRTLDGAETKIRNNHWYRNHF
jgi:hypothetical protein